jgi:hypothetical protein
MSSNPPDWKLPLISIAFDELERNEKRSRPAPKEKRGSALPMKEKASHG